jgi:hypothetical protein
MTCGSRVLSRPVSASNITQQSFLREVEALVAALMGDALPAEVTSTLNRLEAAADRAGEIPVAAMDAVRQAIKLVRGAQPCAAVSSLLAARAELDASPH